MNHAMFMNIRFSRTFFPHSISCIWGRFSNPGCLPGAGPTQVTRRTDCSNIVGSNSNTGTGAIGRQQDPNKDGGVRFVSSVCLGMLDDI